MTTLPQGLTAGTWNIDATMPGGDLLVSDKVNLEIDVELAKA